SPLSPRRRRLLPPFARPRVSTYGYAASAGLGLPKIAATLRPITATAELATAAWAIAATTRNREIVNVVPPYETVSAPPMVQSTAIKVAADSSAEETPAMKSTGASVAIRHSSATRYSGFL